VSIAIILDVNASGQSYPMSALSSPGGDYMDPLDCDASEINCPACLLQVKSIERSMEESLVRSLHFYLSQQFEANYFCYTNET